MNQELYVMCLGRSLSAENESIIKELALKIPRSNYYADYEIFKKSNPNYNYMFFYLVVYQNQIIGFLRILPHFEGDKRAIEINECNILPAYQGKGLFFEVFQNLINDMMTRWKNEHIDFYHLEVDEDKPWLINFYQKFGFVDDVDNLVKSISIDKTRRLSMVKVIK